jgi:intracellular septation protein A
MSNQENVAKRLGLESTESGYELNKKSLLDSIGGPLGIAEAVLPATLFSFAYAFTKDAIAAVVIAAGSSLVFILVRLLQRKALTQAIVGALAIALAAFLALRDGGQAADYFVPGFITNSVYGSVLLISVLVRHPIMGYVAQLLFSLDGWRSHKPSYRRLRLVTLIWVGFFTTRLAVQLPLYFAGAVEALALARAVMGAPAYAGLLALTWVLLRRIRVS